MALASAGVKGDPTLALRERAVRAAQALVAEKGLEVSMDDIAVAAGVGRRSLFRYFESRDDLVAEGLARSLDWFGRHLAAHEPCGEDLDEWLVSLARYVHRTCLDAGKGLWQMAAADNDDLPEPIAALNRRRRADRRRWTAEMANRAWTSSGGGGETPEVVLDAFSMFLSSFSTRSLATDLRVGLDRIATSSAAVLSATIRSQRGIAVG